MADLPIYTSQKADEGLRPSDLGAEAAQRGAARIGAFYHQIGDEAQGTIRELGGAVDQHYALQETATDAQKGQQLQFQAMDAWRQYKASNPNAHADDFVQTWLKPQVESLGQNNITETGQRNAVALKDRLTTSIGSAVYADQVQMDHDNAHAAVAQGNDNAANLAAANPTIANIKAQAGDRHWNVGQLASAALLDNKDGADLQFKSVQHTVDGGLRGMENQAASGAQSGADIDANINALNTDPFFLKYATPENRASAVEKLQNARATSGNIQATVAAAQWDRAMTGVAQGDSDSFATAKGILANPPGETPLARAKFVADRTVELQNHVAERSASVQVNQLPLAQAKTEADALRNLPKLQPEQEAFVKMADTRDTQFRDAPAAYVRDNNPTVGAAWNKYYQSGKPQDFQSYAIASTAEQQRINPGAVPKLVTPEMKQQIATTMQAVGTDKDGAGKASATLEQLHDVTGQYYNQVVHELQDKGVLTGGQFALAQIAGTPDGFALSQEGFRAMAIPEKMRVTDSGIPTPAAEAAMRNALAPLSATFADTLNGHQIMDSFITSGASIIQSRGEKHLGDAQAIADTMVNNRFNVRDNMRISKNFDDHDVATGAESVQAHIDTHDIQPPPSFSGFGQALQRDAYVQDLKDYGYWSTNDRGDGAYLMYQGLPVYEKAKTGQNVPVEVPYKDLENVGRKNRGLIDQSRRLIHEPQTLAGHPSDAIPSIARDVGAAASLITNMH